MLNLFPNRFMVNLLVGALVLLAINEALRFTIGYPAIGCFMAGILIGLQPVLMLVATVFVAYLFFLYFAGGVVAVIQSVVSAWWVYLPGAMLVKLLGDVSPCFA